MMSEDSERYGEDSARVPANCETEVPVELRDERLWPGLQGSWLAMFSTRELEDEVLARIGDS